MLTRVHFEASQHWSEISPRAISASAATTPWFGIHFETDFRKAADLASMSITFFFILIGV